MSPRAATRVVLPRALALAILLALPLAVAGSAAARGAVLEVDVPDAPWRVAPGGRVEVEVVVRNVGVEPATARVGLAWADDDAGASFLEASPPVRQVRVARGGEVAVAFTLAAAPDAPQGAHPTRVVAQWTELGKTSEAQRVVDVVVEDPRAGSAGAAGAAADRGVRLALFAAAGAGAGGLLAGLAALLARLDLAWWRAALVAPLYSRIRRSEVLDQATRRRVFEAVVQHPGIHLSELRRRTGVPNGALYHHLRKLEEGGLVASRRQRGRRVFAVASARWPEPEPLTPAQREVLRMLPPEGLTQGEIARRLRITRQGASYHVLRLEEQGLVARRLVRGRWRCVPVAQGKGP